MPSILTWKKYYKYTLTTDFVIKFDFINENIYMPFLRIKGDTITIPAGYSWDGCSPKTKIGGLIIGVPDFGMNTKYASLVHDALYQYSSKLKNTKRADADRIFLILMGKQRFCLRYVYWGVVRSISWIFWNRDKS